MDEKTQIAYSAFSQLYSVRDYYLTIFANKSELMIAEKNRNIGKISEPEIQHLYSEELYFYFQSAFVDITLKSAIISLFNTIELCLRKLMIEMELGNS